MLSYFKEKLEEWSDCSMYSFGTEILTVSDLAGRLEDLTVEARNNNTDPESFIFEKHANVYNLYITVGKIKYMITTVTKLL